jgi:FkbM family methyltransferase
MIREALARTPIARSRRFRRHVSPAASPWPLEYHGTSYGGWVIPEGLLSADSVCYSAGVGTDVSFDVELIKRYGCTVNAFDPTPTSVALIEQSDLPDSFIFHPWAVGGSNGQREFRLYNERDGSASMVLGRVGAPFVAQCRTIASIMDELGHAHLDLLKLDIEGAEYEVLDSLAADGICSRILCVEFHRTPFIRPMVRAVRRLHEAYVPLDVSYFDTTWVARDELERRKKPTLA